MTQSPPFGLGMDRDQPRGRQPWPPHHPRDGCRPLRDHDHGDDRRRARRRALRRHPHAGRRRLRPGPLAHRDRLDRDRDRRTLRPELGARAKEKGVEWAIDLGITADELVAVIQDAIAGHLEDNPAAQEWEAGGYPGSEEGLSPRESDVLGLVTGGLSNQEIANTLFLSINSVKTYIRSTYRKMGVATRSQAVLWAIQHGFPTPELPPPSPTHIQGDRH